MVWWTEAFLLLRSALCTAQALAGTRLVEERGRSTFRGGIITTRKSTLISGHAPDNQNGLHQKTRNCTSKLKPNPCANAIVLFAFFYSREPISEFVPGLRLKAGRALLGSAISLQRDVATRHLRSWNGYGRSTYSILLYLTKLNNINRLGKLGPRNPAAETKQSWRFQ